MTDWPIVHVDPQTACDATVEAAFTTVDDDGEKKIVHSFAHSAGLALGADAGLSDVLERIQGADEIAWVTHPMKHDLAVRCDGRLLYYAVPRPERSG